MKRDEGGIFSKAPDWKTLFLLKIKIKQNPGCQNKEWKCSLQTLSSEYEGLSWFWKYCILERIWAKRANKFGLSQIQLGILLLVKTTGKFCNFSPFLSLDIELPALKLTENCYLNMKILKNGNLIINWVPLFFYKHAVPEKLSSQCNKMKSLGL